MSSSWVTRVDPKKCDFIIVNAVMRAVQSLNHATLRSASNWKRTQHRCHATDLAQFIIYLLNSLTYSRSLQYICIRSPVALPRLAPCERRTD